MKATQEEQVTIQHGWSETHVVVVFPKPLGNLQLSPEQAEAFITSLRASLAGLAAAKAGKPLPAQLAIARADPANG